MTKLCSKISRTVGAVINAWFIYILICMVFIVGFVIITVSRSCKAPHVFLSVFPQ